MLSVLFLRSRVRAIQRPVGSRLFCGNAKKNKVKKTKKKDNTDDADDDKEEEWIAHLIDTAESVKNSKLPFTAEEKAEHKRIGAEYTRQRMIQDNKFKKDLSTKAWLQQEAIKALPEHLRAAALIVDDTPPPEDRPFPIFMTPPVPGLNLKDESKQDDDAPELEGSKDSEY